MKTLKFRYIALGSVLIELVLICYGTLQPIQANQSDQQLQLPMYSPASVQVDSRLAYANMCAAEMGVIPAFKCTDGQQIPITVGGVNQTSTTTDCDKPVQLEHNCVPGSRLLRPQTTVAGVKVAIICRKYYDTPQNLNEFHDIAIVQHNPATGNTCWFQTPPGTPQDTTGGVPSPMEDSHAATHYWLELHDVNSDTDVSRINCQRCHAADPFIWTPWIGQVVDVNNTNWNPKGKYASNFQHIFDESQPLAMSPTGNSCSNCHRIGVTTDSQIFLKRAIAWNTAVELDPRHSPVKAWMPPYDTTESSWHSLFDVSVAQLMRCFDDPTQSECNASIPSSDNAALIYVNQGNTGVQDGSIAHPFKTIAAAVAAVTPGGTIVIQSGSYVEPVLISKHVAFRNQNGTVIIKAP